MSTDKIIDFANYGNSYNWSFHNGKPYNEMEFLGKIFQTDEDFLIVFQFYPMNQICYLTLLAIVNILMEPYASKNINKW